MQDRDNALRIEKKVWATPSVKMLTVRETKGGGSGDEGIGPVGPLLSNG